VPKRSVTQVRASVCASLEPRRAEVEQAILTRVWAVSNRAGAEDEEYATALRAAVAAGVAHALAGVQSGADRTGPIPAALLAEARQAARSGVTLDVELRRYFAGYTLFCEYVMRTAEEGVPLEGPALRETFHALASVFERLVSAIVVEYRRERDGRGQPRVRSQIDRIKKLLAGEPVETRELAYEFDSWHVGAIAHGHGSVSTLWKLAAATDRHLLVARPDPETIWAWFGGRRRVELAEIVDRVPSDGPRDALVAWGEPARGIGGWRLTHQQAEAALMFARPEQALVRYADVGLVASISQDRLLAASLEQLYLVPLADGRDGGTTLRETLRAYFTAGRNISSAASALGVSRQTVGNRLRTIEEKLDRTLESCAPEIELALRLEDIRDFASRSRSSSCSPILRY
jgi:hypothetical protein